ncbi:DAK2 domain-containing protein [Aureimonas leprariae]|uniref:DAK2 domain-containing protein n=1 Tax=Plantimonas leprariae TaxID=2615207 RepID=A0A7V7U148_9HYPH|nr:DAK2 domain-containing protein [Aureimonas leprariae]KAB0681392.1 DAK2 domain-containing protein [Aureimonas leprariae]
MLRAGKAAGSRAEMPAGELRAVVVAMRDGIVHRGKAAPGQKTMLDAWGPAADAAERGERPAAIAEAARRGAAATRDIVATIGRASRLGDRSLGHRDPGAVSAALIVEAICDAMAGGDAGLTPPA